MRSIAYSQGEFSPFPAAWVEIVHLLGPPSAVLAKLDSGATRTVVPTALLERVGAIRQRTTATCRGYDGEPREWPVFEVGLRVTDSRWPDAMQREFRDLLVLGVEGQSEVLLGRDVLAAWHLHLDGPQSRYSVE